MKKLLQGKTAIITGASKGIGKATVQRFIEEGARVTIADISEDEGRARAAEIGADAMSIRTDVTDEAEVLLLATPDRALPDPGQRYAAALAGKFVLDATNPRDIRAAQIRAVREHSSDHGKEEGGKRPSAAVPAPSSRRLRGATGLQIRIEAPVRVAQMLLRCSIMLGPSAS